MTQSVVGALRVNLGLDAAQFTKGVSQAQQSIERMRGQFAVIAAAAAAAGAALGAMFASTMGNAVEIQRFSQVANAAPEVFQKWAAATQTVGIQQDKLADILKDVNDRVGDFMQTGGGPMADFFENIAPRVGVTADQFARLSGPEALQLYVASLEKAGASQQEMTFYMEALASDATLLLPLLRNNGAEMERLGQKAKDLGVVLDGDAVASLNRARVAIDGVGQVMVGMRNRISVALAPAVEALANGFVSLMEAGGALRRAFDGLLANLERVAIWAGTAVALFGVRYVAALVAAAAATASLSGALAFLRVALIRTGIGALVVLAGELVYQITQAVRGRGGFGAALGAIKDIGVAAFGALVAYAKSIPASMDAVWNDMKAGFFRALSEMATKFHDFVWNMASQFQQVEALSGLGDSLMSVAEGASEASGVLMRASFDAQDAASGARDRAAALVSAGVEPLKEAFARLRGASDEANGAMEDSETRMNGVAVAAQNAAGGIGGMKDAAEQVKTPLDEMKDRIAGGLEGALMGLIDRTSSVADSFRNMAKTIIAEVYRMAVVQPIINGLLGTPGADGTRSGGLLGKIFGGFRAEGGPVMPGKAYMVGERGPEMIVPSSAGTVIPNHALGGGGVVVNQTINVDGGANPATIRQEIARLMPQIADATVGAVIDARRRGGAMKAAFG